MRKGILCSFVFLFMLLNYSCITPPAKADMNQNAVTLPRHINYTGDVLNNSGEVAGDMDFYYEMNSAYFYLKIKTDVDTVADVMDPEFEGWKFIKVHYKPIESEFEGYSIRGNEKFLFFLSELNDQGLIAIVTLAIDEQNNYSGEIDIRTEENYKQILLASKIKNEREGIDPFILMVLKRDARFIGKFLIKKEPMGEKL